MFNFGGGFGGFNGGGRPKDVDNSKLYEILGIAKNASPTEIKKAYRSAAIQHHPDKGGDPEKFKEISKAHEILSDPEKREMYDNYGEDALNGKAGGGGAADFFDLFGGGFGGGRRGQRQKPRGEDLVFPMNVSLEELYVGVTKKLRISKNVICSGCNGEGGESGHVSTCGTCNGQGVRVVVRQIGPGMIQQMQAACDACKGDGKIIPDRYKCKTCKGKKTLAKKDTIECVVMRGSRHGQKISFSGMADEAPGVITGDVVVVIQQKEHDVFSRKGDDLFMRQTLSLADALCGFTFDIHHLDGRILRIHSKPGHVYTPAEVKVVDNEGMPLHRNQFERANLYIEFKIEFPKSGSLSPQDMASLRSILPSTKSSNMDVDLKDDDVDMCTLRDVDMDAERAKREASASENREAYEDDDEHGHQGVGCRSQ